MRRDPDGELPTATACGAEAHDRRTLTPLEPALAGAQLTIPDHGLALAPLLMTVSGDIDRSADGCARAPVAPLLLTVEGPLPVEQVVEVWALSEPRLVAAARVVEADRLRLEIPLDAPLDAGPPLLPGLHVLQLQYTDGVAALTTNISIELFDPAAAATPIPTAVRTGGGPQGPLPLSAVPLLALALGLVGVAATAGGGRTVSRSARS